MNAPTMKSDPAWVAAISSASMNAPVLIDAFTLMVPFASPREHYASIDEAWRVAVGRGFWDLTRNERNFVLTHLCMHMLSRQFQRARSSNIPCDDDALHAMSLEIDPAISMMDNMDEPHGYAYHDDAYPCHRSMEEYYSLITHGGSSNGPLSPSPSPSSLSGGDGSLNDEHNCSSPAEADAHGRLVGAASDDDNNGNHENTPSDGHGDSSQNGEERESGKGQGHGERTPDDVSDDANLHGVERPSPLSMMETMTNTARRAKDSSSFGIGSGSSLIDGLIVSNINPPRNNWRETLGRIMSISRNRKSYQSQERTFSKINVRASAFLDDIIMPGLTSYAPRICMAVDTSGSMRNDDILRALGEAEGIITTGATAQDFSVFCVDTKVKDIQPVSSLADLDITGGGGTDMAPAFEYLSSLSRYQRPDVFVLATDGFVPWEHCQRFMPSWDCMIILLIVNKKGYEKVPKWMSQRCEVLDISA